MSSPPITLHTTIGALFVAMVVTNSLHGISLLQAYHYYRHLDDKWTIISLVTAVMVFDTIHQGLITHAVYIYVISNWGNVAELAKLVPSLSIQPFFNALTALLVQSFMTLRVWRLSRGNVLLTTLLALFVLSEFASVLAFAVLELPFKTLTQVQTLKPLSLTVNILAAAGDLLIALTLCTLLHRSRTGYQRSDTIINKLILFTVNTGLLTSLCALASFIAYMAAPNTFIYVAFYFCIGRLYTNSLLATLNARRIIRNISDNFHNTTDNVALAFRNLPKKPPGTNISIKIDTTKDHVTIHDQDDEMASLKDVTASDQKSPMSNHNDKS